MRKRCVYLAFRSQYTWVPAQHRLHLKIQTLHVSLSELLNLRASSKRWTLKWVKATSVSVRYGIAKQWAMCLLNLGELMASLGKNQNPEVQRINDIPSWNGVWMKEHLPTCQGLNNSMLEQAPQAHHSSVALNMGQVNTDAQVTIMRKQIPESTIITCLHVCLP